MSYRILIAEDDQPWLTDLLTANGYELAIAPAIQKALDMLTADKIDLLMLNLSSSEDAFSWCRQIRKVSHVPLIVLSSNDDSNLKIVALDAGADDYMATPCDLKELLARIRARLRRTTKIRRLATNPYMTAVGDLVIDHSLHDVIIRGKRAGLTHTEFALLALLARNPGKAFSKERIFEQVWGEDAKLAGKTLVVHVQHLRRKIEEDPAHPQMLLTLRGYGYKLCQSRES